MKCVDQTFGGRIRSAKEDPIPYPEALNNAAFQKLLKSSEDSTDIDSENLWESLHGTISSKLDDFFDLLRLLEKEMMKEKPAMQSK